MHCNDFTTSIAEVTDNDHQVLAKIAKRYMEGHPPVSYVFRASSLHGLRRELDYRYDMNMQQQFPFIEQEHYVYAAAKLWSEDDAEMPFSFSCYGPMTLFINGEQVYQANIDEEVFPDRRNWFRTKLKAGWNYFVWQFMNTGTGCGAKFGSGSIKGFPLHFIVPFGEGEGSEGILFTEPIASFQRQYAQIDQLSKDDSIIWHPNMSFNKVELAKPQSERALIESKEGQFVLVWASVEASNNGRYEWRFTANDVQQVICNGVEIESEALAVDASTVHMTLTLQKGINNIFIWLKHKQTWGIDEGKWTSLEQSEAESKSTSSWHELRETKTNELVNQQAMSVAKTGNIVLQCPIKVEGYNGVYLYSGPYDEMLSVEESIALQNTAKLHDTALGYRYWQVDMPQAFVRVFAEHSHYGRWNYPLGVTLYGMLRSGEQDAVAYALQHIEYCTAYSEYSLWDAEVFGAPGINHSIAGMDSLDDCGSFGATMLYAHQIRSLPGTERLASLIAHYITNEQSRLEDGTLYRIRGTTNFMKDTMWCDDLYMSVPYLVRYSKLTNDRRYLDDAIHQLLRYDHYLFEPKLSIMHHVYDMKFDKQNGAYWGRGNGWVLFSLAECLRATPLDHQLRPALLEMYQRLSSGYIALQDAQGMWHQVLNDHDSYPESSCTSMFAYAFAIGVQQQWFEDEAPYVESVRKAWNGLKDKAIDHEGNVYGVCQGSGFAHHSYYYKYDLMPRLNDTHGIGIVMLAGIEASEMEINLQAKQQKQTIKPDV